MGRKRGSKNKISVESIKIKLREKPITIEAKENTSTSESWNIESTTEDEIKSVRSPNRWIQDIYGGQGFVYLYENKYWIVKIDKETGIAHNVFLSQEQWDERNKNLKEARALN